MPRSLKKQLWQWPEGLIWSVTERLTQSSRRAKYQLFIKLLQPTPQDTILDAGAGGDDFRGRNFLEARYPYPAQITALGNDPQELQEMKKVFPQIKVVQGDVRKLPFPDQSFAVVFSNAVLEHVGDAVKQKQFLNECLRVGKKVFITTPAREFPVDPHTLIPLAHWLPFSIRNAIYRALGRPFWASPERLSPVTARTLKRLLKGRRGVRLMTERIVGLPAVHIIVSAV